MGIQRAAQGIGSRGGGAAVGPGDSLPSLDGFSPSSCFSFWDQGCRIQEGKERKGLAQLHHRCPWVPCTNEIYSK